MMAQALRDKVFSDDEHVRVSICCITFNHRDYIGECLEGFLEQEADFRVEVVIHDDASTDGTADIVRDYAARYPTVIRTVMQEENQFSKGVNPYYAYVFPRARGEYIALCDGDDFWSDPTKLARQVAVLDADPGVVITYGAVQAINEAGEAVEHRGGALRDLSPEELKDAVPLNTLTTCFRNIFGDAPPPLFLRSSPIGDLTVWGVLGYHGAGRYIADMPPANYRIHQNGILSLMPSKKQNFMTALARLSLSAYHNERADTEASKRALTEMLRYLNGTRVGTFADVGQEGVSLWKLLRLWVRGRKNRRLASRDHS